MQLEKLTKLQRRGYDDACGLAHALELIGERWAMLIVRELAYGARRFSELKADLPGISANVLAQRLAELEERGIVRKKRLPPPASVQVYEASEWGLEAAPVIAQLGKWAARSPLHDPTLPISHAAIMMSLQTMLDPDIALGVEGKLGFRFGETSYLATLHHGKLDVTRGPVDDCEVLFAGEPAKLAAVIYGGAPFDLIEVEGDLDLAKRFVTLFPFHPRRVKADP